MARIKGTMIEEDYEGSLFVAFESVPALFRAIKQQGWTPQNAMASDIPGDGTYLVFDSLEEAHRTSRGVYDSSPRRTITYVPRTTPATMCSLT